MIRLNNIVLTNKQEHLFTDDVSSPIIKKIVLEKSSNQYAIFINKETCQKLDKVPFNKNHNFVFENDELYIIPTNFDVDIEEDEDILIFDKYTIEGIKGEYWLICNIEFWSEVGFSSGASPEGQSLSPHTPASGGHSVGVPVERHSEK